MKQNKRGLFVKALIALTVVSVVPVLLIGWHVLRADSVILQHEILDKQHTLAHRMAAAMVEEVSREMQLFSVFADLHSNFESHPDFDQQDIDYLRRQNSEISYVGLIDDAGKVLFSSGEKSAPHLGLTDWESIFQICIQQGKPYIGFVRNTNELRFFREVT